MAIPAALVVLPVGILFICSGLLVNLTQAILFVLVRPLAKNWYRIINKLLVESLWLEVVWLFDWWAGIKVELHTDSETYNQLMGKENALLICNHRSDIDWLVGWVLAQRTGCLGSTVAMLKRELKYLPVIGWSMWFNDYVFLERRWDKDEATLKSSFEQLEDFPMPLWLALFVEGTRFTESKLLSAQEFAVSKGLPIPRNVLVPRTKGFVSAVAGTRTFIEAIYDFTFAIPKSQPSPTLSRMFQGISGSVKVELRRHSMEELPETADGIAQWCKDQFVSKDAALERYRTTGIFSEQEMHDIGRPKISLVVVICWCCVVGPLMAMAGFFLTSREGILVAALLLVLVTIVMEILISSSSPPDNSKPPPGDPMKETLLPR
ncbi:1-acyl-sn-glycerol-3-phosphate acyltransferase 3-like [Neltuma alba]|uniref:1-acyl-sn-glycerol-3-phosphate acyltransferase 3-like n=1 Tax=Neltuma alba TaxID=207710 RepID=UPI0010A5A0F4|nr:1-acyl-sn-glycerol-3-phosphate acyltransferase 3-like [Prosopis alba]